MAHPKESSLDGEAIKCWICIYEPVHSALGTFHWFFNFCNCIVNCCADCTTIPLELDQWCKNSGTTKYMTGMLRRTAWNRNLPMLPFVFCFIPFHHAWLISSFLPSLSRPNQTKTWEAHKLFFDSGFNSCFEKQQHGVKKWQEKVLINPFPSTTLLRHSPPQTYDVPYLCDLGKEGKLWWDEMLKSQMVGNEWIRSSSFHWISTENGKRLFMYL